MGTVVDNLTWAAYGDELKTDIGITGSGEDARLGRLLESAAYVADEYFKCSTVPDALPGPVVQGCFEWVRVFTEARGIGVGVTKTKTAQIEETYTAVNIEKAATAAAITCWKAYRGTHRGPARWPTTGAS